MMYPRQTLKAENSNPSGPRGRGEVNKTLVVFASVLLSCLAGAGPAAAQEQIITSQRGTPNNRAVINMAAMAAVERLHPMTNIVRQKAIHPPMPLADLGGDGVRTQRLAGVSGNMGGGGAGGSTGGSPFPAEAAAAPPGPVQP